MSEWKEYKLSELCSDISYGYTISATTENTGYKFLRITDIQGGYVNWNTVPFCKINEQDYLKYKLISEDIVIARTGNSTGENYIFYKNIENKKTVFASYLIRFRIDKNKAIPYYIWLCLRTQKWLNFVSNSASGSAQKGANAKVLGNFPINLPNMSRQAVIADFFRNINNKIELNTQTNQTLEQIAQVIFKHWFIDFAPVHAKANALAAGASPEQAELATMASLSGKTLEEITALQHTAPEAYHQLQQTARAFPSELVESEMGLVPKGWEQTTLSQICEMKNGYAFKSKEWTNDGVPVIKIGSVKPMLIELDGGSFVALENKKLRADFLAQEGDILVSLTGEYIGEVGRVSYQEKAMINQRVAKFIPKEIINTISYYSFIYCISRQKSFRTFIEINSKGSAQANISTKEILSYPITIATKEIHIAFENNVKSLLDKIIVNSGENSSLAKTRDELLPKLLNGEVEL